MARQISVFAPRNVLLHPTRREEREFCGNAEDKKSIGNAAALGKKEILILDKVVHLNLTNLIEVVTRLCELGLRNCISPHAVETENTKLAI